MSVILQDPLTKEITLLCKGADSIIIELLQQDRNYSHLKATNIAIDSWAVDGLRTLMLGSKSIG